MPVAPAGLVRAELDRQATVWAERGHPVSSDHLAALQSVLGTMEGRGSIEDPADGDTREHVPFVLVVQSAVRPAGEAMATTELGGRHGSVNQHAGDIDEFQPIESVGVPESDVYLVIDVERGSEFCGTTPESAVATLAGRGRTPLTVAEGLALLTVRPDVLEKNRCFSLAGSRLGDRRVPAIWISKRAPHLGWCFAGTPHSWLGVASAATRR
ncbi:MAG: hypothetical protein K0Q93_281 [Nocardioidaceae bacterium]|jgi:hypothetical protein|nr:hypothetical protein [Nocardioidaceae bacterium]